MDLELRDLDLDKGTLRVRHGKGDRSRTVGVDEQTAALLARWIDRRRRLSPGARAPIFCTLAGGRIDSSYIRRLLPRLAAVDLLHRLQHDGLDLVVVGAGVTRVGDPRGDVAADRRLIANPDRVGSS